MELPALARFAADLVIGVGEHGDEEVHQHDGDEEKVGHAHRHSQWVHQRTGQHVLVVRVDFSSHCPIRRRRRPKGTQYNDSMRATVCVRQYLAE